MNYTSYVIEVEEDKCDWCKDDYESDFPVPLCETCFMKAQHILEQMDVNYRIAHKDD